MAEPLLAFPIWRTRRFRSSRDLCFVLMPYANKQVGRAFRRVVEPTLEGLGLRVHRADCGYRPDVMEYTWEAINQARLVVADTTGHNPNVFYELGIAHTLGKPVVLIAARSGRSIPFDLKGLRHILYRHTRSGHQQLRKDLARIVRALLDEGPTGNRLVNEVESATRRWRGSSRDASALWPPEKLDALRAEVNPRDLSDHAIAFCTAAACQFASTNNMLHWGTLCARRPVAAEDLIFALFSPQRRPPLRVAHLLTQFPATTKERAVARMREHKVRRRLVETVRRARVGDYVRRNYRRLGLTAGERDELLALFRQTVLPRAEARRPPKGGR